MSACRSALAVAALLLAGALIYWGASARLRAPAAARTPAVPVVAVPVEKRDIAIWLDAVGTVQSPNVVNVRSRVEGELQKLAFVEGQEVRAGQLLAQIDPRPFEAALRQAEANLRRDEAQLAHARSEAARYEELARKGFVSATNVDALRTQSASLDATVAGDRAAVDTANLQLGFTRITSPIEGRVGMRQADPGTMVRASDPSGLVTVAQMRPIAVLFAVPQDQLLELRESRARQNLRVVARSRDGTRTLAEGELTAIDNQVDPSTGQVKMKATFANADGSLWPGEFVAVGVLLRTDRAATVVPSRAVLSGRDGTYVYVVRPDKTAEARPVTVASSAEGFTAIRGGLAAGEIVVLDGQSRLAPGAKLEAKAP